jgi:hypothetical protein
MRDVSRFVLSPRAQAAAELQDLDRADRAEGIIPDDMAELVTLCRECSTWHPMDGPYGWVAHTLREHPRSVEAVKIVRAIDRAAERRARDLQRRARR